MSSWEYCFIKGNNSMMVLGKVTYNSEDDVFIERTKAAINRVESDNEDWLSVDDFLKELETWQIWKY